MSTEYNNLLVLEIAKMPITTVLDKAIVDHATLQAPFVALPSALNMRDLGLIPDSTIQPKQKYRSGSLHNMTAEDLAALRDTYGIKTVFDLRKETERVKGPSPEIKGVRIVWVSPAIEPYQLDLERFVGDSVMEFVRMYDDILRVQANAYRGIMEALRDDPEATILFHCSGRGSHFLF